MTEQESAQLVEVIEAHWPHPAIDDLAELTMARALASVPFCAIERAIMRLVTTGERWQPRAPAIFAALAELEAADRRAERDLEWAERDRQRAIEDGRAVPAPPEVREALRRLGVRLSA